MEDDTVAVMEVEAESECDIDNGKVEVEHIYIKEEYSSDINEDKTEYEIVPNISLSPTCVNSSNQPDSSSSFKCTHTFQGSTVIEVSGTSTPENCSNGKETNPDAFAKRQSVNFPGSSEETKNLKDPIGVDFDSDRILERVKVECNSCDMPVAFEEDVLPETTHGCNTFNNSVKEESIEIKEECSADININNPEKEIISQSSLNPTCVNSSNQPDPSSSFKCTHTLQGSKVIEVIGTSTPENCSNGKETNPDAFAKRQSVNFPGSSEETKNLKDPIGVDFDSDRILERVKVECNSCDMPVAFEEEVLPETTHVKEESIEIKEECSADININNPEKEIISQSRYSDRMDRDPCGLEKSTNEAFQSEVMYMGVRLFQCNLCGKFFLYKLDIERHLRMHERVRPFSYKFCGKSNSYNLLNHENAHTGFHGYSCSVCEKSFSSKENLSKHARLHVLQFICSLCGKSFDSKKNLLAHDQIDSGVMSFFCSTCGMSFSRKCELSSHESAHKEIESHSCEICAKSFPKKYSLLYHMNEHAQLSQFDCNTCGKSFFKKCDLRRHEIVHTRNSQFCCKACNKSFSYKRSLVLHEMAHSGVQPFICNTCGKSYYRKCDLRNHKRAHTGIDPFFCDICGKSFLFKRDLSYHINKHLGVTDFSCNVCGKSFFRKSELLRHERVHADARPFHCKLCQKSFVCKSYLVIHERTHSGVQPGIDLFFCEICGKSFSHKGHLSYHINKHLGVTYFSCNVCGKSFVKKSELLSHERVHTDVRPFHCKLCKKSFAYKSSLVKHEKTHSAVQPFICSTCGKSFTSKYYITRHERTHKVIQQFTCDT